MIAADQSPVTEDVVRRALAKVHTAAGGHSVNVDALCSACLFDDAVAPHVSTARDLRTVKRQCREHLAALNGHTIETPAGVCTLTLCKAKTFNAWILLPGEHTAEELASRLHVRAWFATTPQCDMWLATAKGKDEARRLAAAELERRRMVYKERDLRVRSGRSRDWDAYERGEGAVWAFCT